MRIKKRLQLIASKIPKGSKVADIGTDHAYLPIYLVTEGICPKVIATEVLPGPYLKAKENIERFGFVDRIELRYGSGFKPLTSKESDVAVISGMGAMTIIDIFEESKQIASSLQTIILQPMKNVAELRKYLLTHCYKIIDEDVCKEDGKFYEVLTVKSVETLAFVEADMLFGPILRHKKDPITVSYMKYQEKHLKMIIESLKDSRRTDSKQMIFEYKKRLDVLKEAIK